MIDGMVNLVGTFFIKASTYEFMKFTSLAGSVNYFYSFEYYGAHSLWNFLFPTKLRRSGDIHFLQAVAVEVPLDRILDGVGALEEFGAFFLLVSTAVGIQVFVEEFPHIIRQAEDFQIFGILESVLEFLGHVSEIFGFPHDFADESLLAVQVIVVEFFIQILGHGDPLDDVHSLVAIGIIVGSILVLGF